jgi:hypothetical protein
MGNSEKHARSNETTDPFRDILFGSSVRISAFLLHASKPNGFFPLNGKQPTWNDPK